MAGSVVLIVSCGAIFLLYRFNDESMVTVNNNDVQGQSASTDEPEAAARKSIFA